MRTDRARQAGKLSGCAPAGTANAFTAATMKAYRQSVHLRSLGDELAGVLFLPAATGRSPVLIICHGAGEFKENYFELCELLASRGVATLAIDMHGHGQSAGERYYVNMR